MTREEFYKRYQYNNRTDKIGGGSFGTVYKAYDRTRDREVAIKVQEVKHIKGKEFSLETEYNAIKALEDHPNIANYESVHRFEDGPGLFDYAIMQYYALGNLSTYLKENNLNDKEKSKILVQILQGIAYLHHNSVVHRDIKPGNILVVNRPNEGIIPKITDFGLSKLAEIEDEDAHFKNSFAGGTIQYSSPEQLKGLPLKFNTDLWSFGIIIYEVCTGKSLFDVGGYSTASVEWQSEVMKQILHKNISGQLDEIPEDWRQMAKQCLNRDNQKRPENGKSLLKKIPKKNYNIEEDHFINNSPKKVSLVSEHQNKFNTVGFSEDELATVLIEEEENTGTVLLDTAANEEVQIPLPNQKEKAKTKHKRVAIIIACFLVVAAAGAYAFFNINSSHEFLAKVQIDSQIGYIDMENNQIVPANYANGYHFSNGLAPIKNEGKWGYINSSGEISIDPIYNLATPFSDELAAVKNEKGWIYINQLGEKTIDTTFQLTGGFHEGLASVKKENMWGYMNKKGSIIIECEYDLARPFHEGLAAVKKGGLWGMIDASGSLIVPLKYKNIKDFSEGVIPVMIKDNTWNFIDSKGNLEIEDSYNDVRPFSEGIAAIKKDDNWGFINKTGERVIDFNYDAAGSFINNVAPVKKEGKWGFINIKNKEVIEFIYDYADNFEKVE